MVAGLVALGATDGTDALAQPPPGAPATTTPGRVRKQTAHARPAARAGIVATLPGFELLPDGGSRLFVELTKAATVTEKREARVLTYVIQGARVDHRNNENALVTVHFNTPVTRARLLPVGGNLVFAIDLRADTTATWRLVDSSDGAASVLQIDFPRGAFLPAGEYDPAIDPGGQQGQVSMSQPGAPAAPPPPAAPAPAPPAGPPGPTPP